jgi:PAS domain S-box-containing protein
MSSPEPAGSVPSDEQPDTNNHVLSGPDVPDAGARIRDNGGAVVDATRATASTPAAASGPVTASTPGAPSSGNKGATLMLLPQPGTQPNAWLNALVASLAVIGIIEVIHNFVYPLINPGALLFTAVVYCVITGGIRIGLVSVLLMVSYYIYLFSVPGRISGNEIRDVADMATRLALIAGNMIIIVVMVGILQRRAQALLEAQIDERITRQSREWLVTALQSIGDAVIATDAKGAVSFMNPVAEELTGWTESEAAGQPLTDVFRIINEQTREAVESPVVKVLREGSIVGLANHTVLLARDGREYPIDDSGAPIKSDNGEINGVVMVFRNVSDRKESEDALQKSETLFRATIEQSPIAILILVPDGSVLRTNTAWEKLYDVSRDLLSDYNILQDRQLADLGVMPLVQKAFEGETIQLPLINYDPAKIGKPGHACWIQTFAYAVKNAHGEVTEVVFMVEDVTERQKALQDLKNSEQRYHSLITATAQIIWTTPPGGVVTDMPMWRAFTGQTRTAVQGWGWLDAVHPGDRERAARAWSVAVAHNKLYETEYRVRRHDGVYRYFTVRGVPVLEPSGQVREWVGVCTDITEHKRAQAIANGQKRVLEIVARGEGLNAALETICRFIEEQSDVMCSFLLCDAGAKTLRHGVGPSLPPEFFKKADGLPIGPMMGACGTAAHEGRSIVVEDIATDPLWESSRDIALGYGIRASWSTPVVGGDGKILGTFAMYYSQARRPTPDELRLVDAAIDLASIAIERAQAEDNLRNALTHQERAVANLTSLIEHIADGVIVADADGRIVMANEVARQLHGVHYIGKTVEEYSRICPVFTTDNEPMNREQMPLVRALQGNETVLGAEWKIGNPDESPVIVQGNAAPVRRNDGQSLGAVLTLRDVTEQRKLVAELQHVNRMKDEFLAILSHELRTPLTPIMGWVSLLRQVGAEDPEMFKQAVDSIERNAELQKRLVNDLLDTSRIVSGKLYIEQHPNDLNEIAEMTIHSCQRAASGRDIRIDYQLDGALPILNIDGERIHQVLLNIISNSVKFSPDGGTVWVRTYLDEEQPLRAFVEVRDEGQGIEAELLPHIFDIFRQGDSSFTRKHGGLGLGLAISKSLVEMHGGSLWATSEGTGHGAQFHIALPIARQLQERPNEVPTTA